MSTRTAMNVAAAVLIAGIIGSIWTQIFEPLVWAAFHAPGHFLDAVSMMYLPQSLRTAFAYMLSDYLPYSLLLILLSLSLHLLGWPRWFCFLIVTFLLAIARFTYIVETEVVHFRLLSDGTISLLMRIVPLRLAIGFIAWASYALLGNLKGTRPSGT